MYFGEGFCQRRSLSFDLYKMKKALLVLDTINDIIHPDGKLSKKWYSDFAKANNSIANINQAISAFRNNNDLIIFVKVWFLKWYSNQPKQSPLFWKANEFWVLELWTRWTEIIDWIDMQNEQIITKHRVSPFFETNLEKVLQGNNIKQIFLSWCATDLVVESTARDWHDRDYEVFVLQDCCIAANNEDHNKSLETIKKISTIIFIENLQNLT